MTNTDIHQIAEFMRAGGQTVPDDLDRELKFTELTNFINRTIDEVQETVEAAQQADYAEILDGFIDTAYVALSGAIRLVGEKKAIAAWEAVVDANTAKIDGRYGDIVRDPDTGKILKPEGWQAPDIQAIIDLKEIH